MKRKEKHFDSTKDSSQQHWFTDCPHRLFPMPQPNQAKSSGGHHQHEAAVAHSCRCAVQYSIEVHLAAHALSMRCPGLVLVLACPFPVPDVACLPLRPHRPCRNTVSTTNKHTQAFLNPRLSASQYHVGTKRRRSVGHWSSVVGSKVILTNLHSTPPSLSPNMKANTDRTWTWA